MAKQRRRAKNPALEYETYCIKIISAEFPYSFSVTRPKGFFPGPYWESAYAEIKGEFLFPRKHSGKSLNITLMGDRKFACYLNDLEKYQFLESVSVGNLIIRGEDREYVGSVPMDVLPMLVQSLMVEKHKHIILNGLVTHYGIAPIHSIHFINEFDIDEYV